MPSWDIHARVAEILGLDPVKQNEVDRVIDTVYHDIGRLWPDEILVDRDAELLRFTTDFIERCDRDREFYTYATLHHITDVLGYVEPSLHALREDGISVNEEVAIRTRIYSDLEVLLDVFSSEWQRRVFDELVDRIIESYTEVRKALKPWVIKTMERRRSYLPRVLQSADLHRVILARTTAWKYAALESGLLDYALAAVGDNVWMLKRKLFTGGTRRSSLLRSMLSRAYYIVHRLRVPLSEEELVETLADSARLNIALFFKELNPIMENFDENILIEKIAPRLAREYVKACKAIVIASIPPDESPDSWIFWCTKLNR